MVTSLTPAVAYARSIFLIDHAWTCRVTHARQQLQQVPGLLHRMANLMGVEFHGELPSAEAVDLVLEEMWKFNQTYQLAHGVSGQPGLCHPMLSGLVGGGPLTPQVSRLPFPASGSCPGSLRLHHGPVTLRPGPASARDRSIHMALDTTLSQTPRREPSDLAVSCPVPAASSTLLNTLSDFFPAFRSRVQSLQRALGLTSSLPSTPPRPTLMHQTPTTFSLGEDKSCFL